MSHVRDYAEDLDQRESYCLRATISLELFKLLEHKLKNKKIKKSKKVQKASKSSKNLKSPKSFKS